MPPALFRAYRPLILGCLFALSGTPAASAVASPVEIDNCGRTLSLDAPPERVVTIGQGTTEILLSMGLGERIVGSAVWLAPLPETLAEEGETLPRLADNSPSFEAVLATHPDLVLVQWLNDVGPKTSRVATFEQFEELGVPVYVSASECAKSEFSAGSGDGARQTAWSMDLLEREIGDIASLFRVPERGETLIERNRQRVATARAKVENLEADDVSIVYWFSSPTLQGDAYVAGDFGTPGWISDALGIDNVIDSHEEWPLVGWETLASLDPDVIVLGAMERRNLPADDVDRKRHFLETDPVASRMSAVRNGLLVELDAQSMNPTLRAVDGVEVIADALQDEETDE